MTAATAWLESLSPWPKEFGLGRMQELLLRLGSPEGHYPAIHVVGSNGKSTTTRTVETALLAEGLHVGAYLSPHVTGWSERIRAGGEEAELERALERVRPAAERLSATQFEVLTAAALAEFAEQSVDVAVVEAGLGGRLDATNVLGARVVVLTNVSLGDHALLGETREAVAGEKLAVVRAGSTVVLGEPEWLSLAEANGAGQVLVETGGNAALAAAATSAFLGRRVEVEETRPAGRLERRGRELWDGAHNPAGVLYLLGQLEEDIDVVVASVLDDKDADAMLASLSRAAGTLVATASGNPRALPAEELAARARAYFSRVEVVAEPGAALARARELTAGTILVTGSHYLLADLHVRQEHGVR